MSETNKARSNVITAGLKRVTHSLENYSLYLEREVEDENHLIQTGYQTSRHNLTRLKNCIEDLDNAIGYLLTAINEFKSIKRIQ